MYKRTILIVTVLICTTALVAIYLHEQAHRYDIVAAGAGGGGSNDQQGQIEVNAWLIDHKTGKIWEVEWPIVKPTQRYEWDDYIKNIRRK